MKHSRLITVQKKCLTYTVGGAQAEFIRMKSTSKKRTPSIVNLTVKRRYLTEREVERLKSAHAARPAISSMICYTCSGWQTGELQRRYDGSLPAS